MKILTKKEQRELVDKIIANAVIAQEAIIKADLPVEQFADSVQHLIDNTADMVYAINGKEGLEKLIVLTI